MLKRLRSSVILILSLVCAASVAAQQSQPSPAEVEKRVTSILIRMTLEEKVDFISGIKNMFIRPIPRLGIPALKMSDGPMGVRTWGRTTAYPGGIALAASWDTALAQRVGAMMGKDARARGVNFWLAPGMNIYRAPQCGRNFEYLGEDPYLAARMAVALIKGVQGEGVIATAKHFAANNSEFDRMHLSSDVDERTLREIYLPAFEASVKEAKVGAIMDSYNRINGVHLTQNGHLNNEILKQEWGFDGIVMSDWGATHDGIAAFNNGLDLEMPSGEYMNRKTLLPAIQEGKISVATLDDKVRRILRKAIEFGFLDRPQADASVSLYNQQARQVALEAARAGMVLLKNSAHLLPLDPAARVKTIAVVGPNAYPAVLSGGGSAQTSSFTAVSYLEGISGLAGSSAKVLYAVDTPALDEAYANTPFVTAPGGETGLKGEYFENQDLRGAPALKRTDAHIAFDWGEGSYREGGQPDHFSARWTGYYIPPATANYQFAVSGDDGYRLFIDDEQVFEDWSRHGTTTKSYIAHLEAGKPYKVKLEYYEEVGGANIGFGVVPADEAIGRETSALAAKSDVAIVSVGFDPSTESEGGDRTFALPPGQDELIQRIARANKNTIVVITAGGNVDMTKWIDSVAGVIHAWYPGQEGGTALAEILFGKINPSGKLPASFERRWEDNATYNSYYPAKGETRVTYKEGVFLGYRHFDRSGVKPMFPFGYGLSYTTFKYSNLTVSPASSGLDAPVTVAFDVKNTGAREGAEVAQLYVSDGHASVPRPVKELKGFVKVNLHPGQTRRVTLTLNRRAFSYYDVNKQQWTAEPGEFAILVGGSSADIALQGTFRLR